MSKMYPQITVYIRPWCGSVMCVKPWLDQRGIPFTEIDITKDEQATPYVEELNGEYQSVPTILFDGEHVATEPRASLPPSRTTGCSVWSQDPLAQQERAPRWPCSPDDSRTIAE
jgi:glutaredoxin